jgi:undecaprenyl-phosphate 4-deoxy-4-formamido-L-arabinose transferase
MSADPHLVSVVAPLLDEERTVRELVERIATTLAARGLAYEIVLVDDGSRDATPVILREIEAANPRVRVFELTRNFGQAAALACGLFEARGDVVVTLDADLQNPPEEIPKLLDALAKGADIATAARAERHEGFLRWLGSRGIHWLARRLTGARVRDFGGQFKAYRRVALDATRRAWAPGKPFFPLALWLGFPVEEVVVAHVPRRSGASRYTLRSLLRINLDLVTAFSTAPLAALGVAGGLFLGAGFLGLALCLALRPADWLPGAASLTLLGVGAVLLAAGVLGQYLGRVYRQVAGGGPAYVVRRGPQR